MSTTGLQSGLYREIRELAELFDSVLIAVKSKAQPQAGDAPRQLGATLVRLANPEPTAPQDQLLASLLAVHGSAGRARLSKLGSDLLAGVISPRLIDELESLAELIEQERAGTFAKIRGRQ